VSSRFSHSNLKRGLITAAMAIVVTVVTYFVGDPIIFGVLHLLAVCMLLYAVFGKYLERLPEVAAPVIYIVLLVGSAIFVHAMNPVRSEKLWVFGLYSKNFSSGDYFPILPWLFVFLLGAWAGKYIRERRLPERFYTFDMPILPELGRHSLWIYMLHQPVLYGLALLIRNLVK
jgi:uncharacterized membrane protein